MTQLKVEYVPLASLQADPQNAREHGERNLGAIKTSLQRFGQVRPLVVYGDVVIAGNGTMRAAAELGWKQIAVARVPKEWDYDTARAYALADNRTAELAEWNSDVLAGHLLELDANGWDLADLGFEPLQPPTGDELADAFGNLAGDRGELEQITFTLTHDQADTVREALQAAKALGEFVDTGNPNGNGNAIARVCELFLGSQV